MNGMSNNPGKRKQAEDGRFGKGTTLDKEPLGMGDGRAIEVGRKEMVRTGREQRRLARARSQRPCSYHTALLGPILEGGKITLGRRLMAKVVEGRL